VNNGQADARSGDFYAVCPTFESFQQRGRRVCGLKLDEFAQSIEAKDYATVAMA